LVKKKRHGGYLYPYPLNPNLSPGMTSLMLTERDCPLTLPDMIVELLLATTGEAFLMIRQLLPSCIFQGPVAVMIDQLETSAGVLTALKTQVFQQWKTGGCLMTCFPVNSSHFQSSLLCVVAAEVSMNRRTPLWR
jgi:hypothetical protein